MGLVALQSWNAFTSLQGLHVYNPAATLLCLKFPKVIKLVTLQVLLPCKPYNPAP